MPSGSAYHPGRMGLPEKRGRSRSGRSEQEKPNTMARDRRTMRFGSTWFSFHREGRGEGTLDGTLFNTMINNEADLSGGGICVVSSLGTLIQGNTIKLNEGGMEGGGICSRISHYVSIINNSILENMRIMEEGPRSLKGVLREIQLKEIGRVYKVMVTGEVLR